MVLVAQDFKVMFQNISKFSKKPVFLYSYDKVATFKCRIKSISMSSLVSVCLSQIYYN